MPMLDEISLFNFDTGVHPLRDLLHALRGCSPNYRKLVDQFNPEWVGIASIVGGQFRAYPKSSDTKRGPLKNPLKIRQKTGWY
jgi:hypothetical protein